MDLLENLKLVKEVRAELATLKATLEGDRAAFDKLHSGLTELIQAHELDLKLLEGNTRALALLEFDAKGEKHLIGGVGIRIKSVLHYDQQKAVEWCEENMKAAFERVWDKKTFEDYLKSHDLSFVTKETVPEATLPREIVLPKLGEGS